MALDDGSLVQCYLVGARYLWRGTAGVFQQLRLEFPTIVGNEVGSVLRWHTLRCGVLSPLCEKVVWQFSFRYR